MKKVFLIFAGICCGLISTGCAGAPEDPDKSPFENFNASLTAPTVTVTNNLFPGGMDVSWSAVSGASSYIWYKFTDPDGDYIQTNTTSVTTFDDQEPYAGAYNGTIYYYAVAAKDNAGNIGFLSEYQYGYKSNYIGSLPPSPPTGFSVSGQTSTSISLSWTAITGVTGYRVYRSTSNAGGWIKVGSVTTGATYTDTGLSSATTYYYKINSYTSSGFSIRSSSITGTTL